MLHLRTNLAGTLISPLALPPVAPARTAREGKNVIPPAKRADIVSPRLLPHLSTAAISSTAVIGTIAAGAPIPASASAGSVSAGPASVAFTAAAASMSPASAAAASGRSAIPLSEESENKESVLISLCNQLEQIYAPLYALEKDEEKAALKKKIKHYSQQIDMLRAMSEDEAMFSHHSMRLASLGIRKREAEKSLEHLEIVFRSYEELLKKNRVVRKLIKTIKQERIKEHQSTKAGMLHVTRERSFNCVSIKLSQLQV